MSNGSLYDTSTLTTGQNPSHRELYFKTRRLLLDREIYTERVSKISTEAKTGRNPNRGAEQSRV